MKTCVICLKSSSNRNKKDEKKSVDDLLEEQCAVIYFFNKFLHLEKDLKDKSGLNLHQLLTSYGNPSEWIEFCEQCFSLVEKGKRFDKSLQELEYNLEKIKTKVVDTIKKTRNKEKNDDDKDLATLVRTSILKLNSIKVEEQDQDDKILDEIQIKREEFDEDDGNNFDHDFAIEFQHDDDDEICINPENYKDGGDAGIKSIRKRKTQAKDVEDSFSVQNDDDDEPTVSKRVKQRRTQVIQRPEIIDNDDIDEDEQNFNQTETDDNYSSQSCNSDSSDSDSNHRKITEIPKKKIVNVNSKSKRRRRHNSKPSQRNPRYLPYITCPFCKIETTKKSRLVKHLFAKSSCCPPNQSVFSCHLCPQTFTSRSSFATHFSSGHKYEQIPISDRTCHICGMIFVGTVALKNHLDIIHEKKESYHCSTCDTSFIKITEFSSHIHSHLSQELKDKLMSEGKLSVCTKTFQERQKWDKDIITLKKEQFLDDKDRSCSICQKVFKSLKVLLGHVKSVHGKSIDTICQICGKIILRQSLKRHMTIHEKDPVVRNFICNENGCGRSFKTPKSLRQHKNIKHDPVKYKCPTCDQGYPFRYQLASHQREQEHYLLQLTGLDEPELINEYQVL